MSYPEKPANIWINTLINSLLLILISSMLIFVPLEIYHTIIVFIGALILISGLGFIFYIIRAQQVKFQTNIVWYIQALINIALGLFLILKPEFILNLLHYFISFSLILIGIIQILLALKQKEIVKHVSYLRYTSLLSIILGITILFWPQFPLVILGYIGICIGIILLLFAFIFYFKGNQISNQIDSDLKGEL